MSPSNSHRSGSQGKGSRRGPWRDGGAHKQRSPEWRKQAMHAVAELAELGEPFVVLPYRGRYGETPSHAIYRLDQEMTRSEIRYYPEYQGRWRGFTLSVAVDHRERAQEVIARLERRE
jgi:hypothetical protein